MKKFFITFLLIFTIGAIYINLGSHNMVFEKEITTSETTDVWGERLKNDWIEGLMEFAGEDDTLDSLDYVPDFLR